MRSFRLLAIGVVALAATAGFAQQTYNSGNMLFKRIGHNQWGKPGEFGYLDWSAQTNPAYAEIPLGLFVDIPVAGLTGAGLVVTIGGAVGPRIEVWGKNGELNVEYPCGVTLSYPDPATLRPGDPFTISSSYTRNTGGSMSTTAPDFGFALGGLLDVSVKLDARVSLFGETLASETIFEKGYDDIEVGIFNTDLPGFKEAVGDGGNFELFSGIVEGTYGFPQVTTAGGDGPGNTLISSGQDEFLSVVVSITDAILTAMGLPIDLNGSGGLDGFWGEFTWDFHLLDLRLESGFSIAQEFDFDPRPIVELNLSNGAKHTFFAGDSVNLIMPAPAANAESNNLTITPVFSMEGSATNKSKLVFDLSLVFDPFSFSAHVKVGGEFAGEFLGVDEHIGPIHIVDPIELYGTSFDVELIDKTFDVKGFNAIMKTPFTVEGYRYPKATIGQLSPILVKQGDPAFTLSVGGNNFVDDYTNGSGTVDGSTVRIGSSARTTTFVSASQLDASILAADLLTEGKKAITVANPAPGGGNSNTLELIVDGSAPTISGTATPSVLDKTGNKNVLITVTVSGTMTDLLSGLDVTTGTYSVVDEYGQINPSGAITIFPNGSYSFNVRLSPVRQAKDKNGRLYAITIKVKDNLGFEGSKVVNVVVPQ